MLKALTVRPRQRFQSAEEFSAALYAAESVPPVPDPPKPPEPPIPEPPVPQPPIPPVVEEPEICVPVKPTVHKDTPQSGKNVTVSREDKNVTIPGDSLEAVDLTDVQDEEEEKPRQRKKPWLWIFGAVGALCLILLLVFLPKSGSEAPAETEHPAPTVETRPDYSEAIAYAVERALCDEAELRRLLADDNVPAVKLTSNIGMELIEQPLVLTKPLILQSGACLELSQSVTVAEGGLLQVEGDVTVNSMIHADGGEIIVASTGKLMGGSGRLLLTRESDLTVEDGGEVESWLREKTTVFCEEDIFRDAVHVTSWDELVSYADISFTKAIVIDADITLKENLDQRIPIMISPGVTVDTNMDEPWDFDHGYSWDVEGSVLVNYGTITGCVNVGDWDDSRDDNSVVLNYGTIGHTFFVNPGHRIDEDGDGYSVAGNTGVLYNFGTLDVSAALVADVDLYNLGTINYKAAENIDMFDIQESVVFNGGYWGVEGWMTYGSSELEIFLNAGTLELAENGVFVQSGHMMNTGSLTLTHREAEFNNHGLIESKGSINAIPDSKWYNDGLVFYSRCSTLELNRVIDHDDMYIPFAWDWRDSSEGTRYVTTEEELREQLESEDCQVVVIDEGEIHLTDGLGVHKKILAVGGGKLYTDGHELALEDAGYLYCNGDQLDMGAGKLTLRWNSAAYVSNLANADDVEVSRGSRLLIRNDRLESGSGWDVVIDLTENSDLISLNYCSMKNTMINLGKNCILRNLGGMRLQESYVRVISDAEFRTEWADLVIDQGNIINYGHVIVEAYHEMYELTINEDASMEDFAWTEFYGPHLDVYGMYNNNGGNLCIDRDIRVYGKLFNRSGITSFGGAGVQVMENGEFSGRDPVDGGNR